MLTSEIKNSFQEIIEGSKNQLNIKNLYNYCYKIAEASVWAKLKMSPNDQAKLGTTPKQIAYDAVSQLFINNAAGVLNIQQS